MKETIPANVLYKTPLIAARTPFLCDTAGEVLCEMAAYCEERGLPFELTDSVSTEAEDVALDRVSDEHRGGRAFDFSLHGWIDLAVRAFVTYFEQKFISVAAVGLKSGTGHLIVIHDNGHGRHAHVQVSRTYALADPLRLKKSNPPVA